MRILDAIDGKKTYILGVSTAVLNALIAFNVIPKEYFDPINGVMVALLAITLRDGMNKSGRSRSTEDFLETIRRG